MQCLVSALWVNTEPLYFIVFWGRGREIDTCSFFLTCSMPASDASIKLQTLSYVEKGSDKDLRGKCRRKKKFKSCRDPSFTWTKAVVFKNWDLVPM